MLALAHAVANAELRRRGAYLGMGRYDDLVAHLVTVGCQIAIGYDPSRSRGGYNFASYAFDVMKLRVTDFCRRKSEGFDGDHRYAASPSVELVGDWATVMMPDAYVDFPIDPEDDNIHAAAAVMGEGLTAAAAWTLMKRLPLPLLRRVRLRRSVARRWLVLPPVRVHRAFASSQRSRRARRQ